MENEYLRGFKNNTIRTYFYLSNGLAILNEFRNLFLVIFATYFTLKITNPLWIGGMTILGITLLTIAGYVVVHHVAKVKEWLSVKYGTHYGVKNFDYIKHQTELLEEIKELLKK